MSMLASLLLIYIQWSVIPAFTLLTWGAIMGLVSLYRLILFSTFQKEAPAWQEAIGWRNLFTSGSIAMALVWGAAGIWLLPDNHLYLSLTFIVIIGIATGSISTLSPLRLTVFTFVCISASPLIIHLLLDPSIDLQAMAALSLIYFTFILFIAHNNYKSHLQDIKTHLQSIDRENALQKSNKTILDTSKIFKMIAQGEGATKIYSAIVMMYESRYSGMRCSILTLYQGNTLLHASAPSLPKAYCDAINGIKHGGNVGSFGASTYTGQRVIVENIEADSKWEIFKDATLIHGMRSCWSEPVKSPDGQVLGVFSMYYDHAAQPNQAHLTDLESAAQLSGIVMERENREKLLNLHSNSLAQAGEAIIITNIKGDIEYVNQAFTNITGYSSKEAIGKNPSILNSGKQDQTYYQDTWHTITKGNVWSQKITEKKKDGTLYTAHMTIAPVKDKNKKITHYVSFHNDLSEFESLEEQFFQAQKLESIGVLVGGIAHDFNNIMAAIKGNVYLAMLYMPNPDKLQPKLASIDELSTRAADMTKQLLTFARKDKVEMKTLSLNTFIQEAFKFACTNLPENIEHECIVCAEDLFISGDKTQLQQVLMNLLNNAHHALQNTHAPKLTCTLSKLKPDEHFLTQHPTLRHTKLGWLSLHDNGCGIDKDDLNHIFEPFFTTKGVNQGTGLGLAMVYGAVQRHKAVIEVKSTRNKGTEFHIYFPLTQQAQEENTNTKIAIQGHRETILLVDDDADMLESTSEVLNSFNYLVLQAKNGQEALHLYQKYHHDISIVLTDVIMPIMGGLELARAIRLMHASVPILFVTGYDRQILSSEQKVPHSKVITKPFIFESLSQTIQTMIYDRKKNP